VGRSGQLHAIGSCPSDTSSVNATEPSQRHSRQIRTKASTEPVALRVRPRPGNTAPTIPEPLTQTHSCIERSKKILTGSLSAGSPSALVNGQVAVPGGGQLKVPTLRG
jgi:hypothetical protein